jgi:hypothetical protein
MAGLQAVLMASGKKRELNFETLQCTDTGTNWRVVLYLDMTSEKTYVKLGK